MLDLPTIWRNVLDASGIYDEAQEYHGHDLLDGIEGEAHGAPLEHTFVRLCKVENVTELADVERVLARMRMLHGFEGLCLPQEVIERVLEDRDDPAVGICDHTSVARGTYSDRWGTPLEVLKAVVGVCGPIEYDLATDEQNRERMEDAGILGGEGQRYWTAEDRCPRHPDVRRGVVWCNPPGPRTLVEEFWAAWLHCIEQGATGAFLIFKQDHWRALASPSVPCTTVVLRKRLKFVRSAAEERAARQAAEDSGRKYVRAAGANFPSTLVFSGRLEGARLARAAELGHVLYWG